MKRVVQLGLLLATLCSCSVAAEDTPAIIDEQAVPFDLLDPEAPNIAEVEDGRNVSVCLLRDERLVVVDREVQRDAGLRAVIASLAAVTDVEAGAGLESAVSGVEEISGIDTAAGVAIVDFEAGADQTLTPDPLATIAQLVCTLTAQPGIGSVRFTVDGDAIDVPRANGSLTDAPVSRDDYTNLFAEA